jgi:uncharacterized protein with PIN domain
MSRNKALLDLLDELNDGPPMPRRVDYCVVCGGPIKSVNGRALCGVAVHPVNCMVAHIATCAQCQKEMEANEKQKQTFEA